jgi:hypothetical protein
LGERVRTAGANNHDFEKQQNNKTKKEKAMQSKIERPFGQKTKHICLVMQFEPLTEITLRSPPQEARPDQQGVDDWPVP